MTTTPRESGADRIMKRLDERYRQVISNNIDNFDGSQNRHELGDALRYLEDVIASIPSNDIWFLEIGGFKGLWALAFWELCHAAGKTPHYVTVTWVQQDPANKDIFSTEAFYREQGAAFQLIDMNSTTPAARDAVDNIQSDYHLVLIDGDHSFASVMADISNYGPLATHALLFHDIYTRDCGVRKAIDKSEIRFSMNLQQCCDRICHRPLL